MDKSKEYNTISPTLNLEHLMANLGLNWDILYNAQHRQHVANMQNLEMLRNGPNSWWKDKDAPKGLAGTSFNFQNPFDNGPKGEGNSPPTGNGPSGSGGWTPPSGNSGGWGRFWQAASNFMQFGMAKPLSPFMQTMMDYKPTYNLLYETKLFALGESDCSKVKSFTVGERTKSAFNYINEPGFLYDQNEYNNALSEARGIFIRNVADYLSSSHCTDDMITPF